MKFLYCPLQCTVLLGLGAVSHHPAANPDVWDSDVKHITPSTHTSKVKYIIFKCQFNSPGVAILNRCRIFGGYW